MNQELKIGLVGSKKMTKIYLLAKKIHRMLVLMITFLSLLMGATGLMLKYPTLNFFGLIDLGLARYLHNQLSPLFGIGLTLMITTGVWMYLYPALQKRK